MKRLAKARLLASVLVEQEEREQQIANQQAWEDAVKTQQVTVPTQVAAQPTSVTPEVEPQKSPEQPITKEPEVVASPTQSQDDDAPMQQIEEPQEPIRQFEAMPDPEPAKPSYFRKSKFLDQQQANPSSIQLKPQTTARVGSGFVFAASKPKPSGIFAASKPQKPVEQAQPDDEDPLDAYMSTIKSDVVDQEQFHSTTQAEDNVITADDLMADDDEGQLQDNQSFNEPSEEDSAEEEFHRIFMEQLRKKDEVERMNNSMGVNFEEDDYKFISDLEKGPKKRPVGTEEVKTSKVQSDERFVIRKDLYIESKEITSLTEKQVKVFRKESGNIQVRGLNCPRPIQNWYQCGLPTSVLNFLKLKNFQKPFPIQCQSLPICMSGRDMIGIAETGSGKTLAYVLPMLRHIRDQPPLNDGDGPIGIVFAPTRELVLQIYKETKKIASACDLNVVPVYGGVSVENQLSNLKRGTEIVVCTPGRMRDVLAVSNGRITNLRRVSYVVLDEADRMLDMGFEPQIKVMIQNCQPERQIVMFSATFPRAIENLAKSVLKQPIEVVVGQRGQTCSAVDQKVEVLHDNEDKLWKLVELLGLWYEKGSILIFVEKQNEADDLFKELYNIGYKCLVLHGGMDQTDREFTIQDFKNEVRNVMIATSICARGLDIKHIKLVVNYVCPSHIEDYVHRIGRTGRAGNKGTAVTFITADECGFAADLIRVLDSSNLDVPEQLKDLEDLYLKKLSDGDIEKRRSNGFVGKGYKHTDEERLQIKKQRHELAKSHGLPVDEDMSDDESAAQNLAKQEMDQLKQEHYHQVSMLERDPIAKKHAVEVGQKAAIEAIKQGLSYAEAQKLSQEAINLALQQYKPGVVGQEKAIQQVMKVRDKFIREENQRSGIHTEELEINDLPPMVRAKVQSRDFIQTVTELCGTHVHLGIKGQLFESGSKPQSGQKRLHLLIEAPSAQEAQGALKEIKRHVEEVVQHQQFAARAGGTAGYGSIEFSGQFGKF